MLPDCGIFKKKYRCKMSSHSLPAMRKKNADRLRQINSLMLQWDAALRKRLVIF
jgi:hypothetical protein